LVSSALVPGVNVVGGAVVGSNFASFLQEENPKIKPKLNINSLCIFDLITICIINNWLCFSNLS
jgi:hypothetical protein